MTAIGRRVYSLGAILLGVVQLAFGAFSSGWLPVPSHIHGYHLLAYAAGGLLIGAGLAINLPRFGAIAALLLAAFFAGAMLVLEFPPALAKPAVWVSWQGVAESTVMALGGVLAFTQSGGGSRAAMIARIATLAFGVCLLIFGGSHFVYAKFTASLVPAALPPSQLFWAYATGAAQIAAGMAMLSGIQARLAAILLTVMYAAFSILVHIPSVMAEPHSRDNWTENGINLLLIGAAWCLADSLSTLKKRRRGR